ncbi:MAG: hypothetical protein AAF656_01550 [Planctomycetota bacterium]
MDMTCNIDAKGRLIRGILASGALIVAGVLGVLWAWPSGSVLPWLVVAAAVALGCFGMYEAKRGWCAARALGFKTPF